MLFGEIQIYPDLNALSKAAADAFILIALDAIQRKGRFSVALTGGTTVQSLYQILASQAFRDRLDWTKGLFYWGDERLVPPDHAESNYGQANQLFLCRLDIKPENIFRIRGELPLSKAVEDYRKQLKKNADEGLDWPCFDLVLLSLGSDGHIASIFPGEISEAERTSPVIAIRAEFEGRPADRVSLTPLVFNSARNIFLLVAGENKRKAFNRIFSGKGDPAQLPALGIRPRDGRIIWFVDKDAAGLLSQDELDKMGT